MGSIRHLLLVIALLAAAPASAWAGCGDPIIEDYLNDGSVDGTYTQPCFDDALANLDDDLREYTNAETDIRNAKLRQKKKDEAPTAPPQTSGTPSSPTTTTPSSNTGQAPATEDGDSQGDGGGGSGGGGSGGDDAGGSGGSGGAGEPERSGSDVTEPAGGIPDGDGPNGSAPGGSDDPTTVEGDGGLQAEEQGSGTGEVLDAFTDLAAEQDVTADDGPLQQALRDVGPTNGDDLPMPVIVLGGLAVLLIAVGAGGIVVRRMQSGN